MRFFVSEIRAARLVEVEQDLDAKILGEPPSFAEFPRRLHATAQARMSSGEILVSGQVKTAVSLSCARCLEKFEREIESHFEQRYSPDDSVIDVSEEIREAVIVDLPLTAVCRPDCAGICPTCGANRNTAPCACAQKETSPRWDDLKRFQSKKRG